MFLLNSRVPLVRSSSVLVALCTWGPTRSKLLIDRTPYDSRRSNTAQNDIARPEGPASSPTQCRSRFTDGPLCPTDRASSYPEVTNLFCRLPLSGFFRLTRGYSPWRPAAVIGTACVWAYLVPRLFMGSPKDSRRSTKALRSSRPEYPPLRLTRFRGQCGR